MNWETLTLFLSKVQDTEMACDAAGALKMGENRSQIFTDEEENKCLPHVSSEESSGKWSIFSAISFSQNLWLLVESEEFKTTG